MPTYKEPITGKKIISEKELTEEELIEAFSLVGLSEEKGAKEIPPSPPEADKKENATFNFPLALQNLGENTWQYLKTFLSPQTYMGLVDLAKTAGQIASPSPLSIFSTENPYKKVFNMGQAIANEFLSKYGSWENIKNTFQNTPLEPILDLSMVLTGGGSLLAEKAGWLGKLGKTAQTAGMAGEPINIATSIPKGFVSLATPKINQITQRLYLSSLNLPKHLNIEELKRVAKTGLESGIVVNEKGLNKLKGMMDEVSNSIKEIFETGSQKGEYIDSWRIVDKIDEAKGLFSKLFVDPKLERILDNLKMNLLLTHGEKIPIKEAQRIKQLTQKHINYITDRMGAIKNEAEKIAVAEVKRALEELHPELKNLNTKMQEYVWLKEAIEEGVRKEMQAPIFQGLSFYNAVARRTFENPSFKSNLAKILNNLKNKQKFSAKATLGREFLYKTSPESEGRGDLKDIAQMP